MNTRRTRQTSGQDGILTLSDASSKELIPTSTLIVRLVDYNSMTVEDIDFKLELFRFTRRY